MNTNKQFKKKILRSQTLSPLSAVSLGDIRVIVVMILIAIATIVVYWPIGGYEFVHYDDKEYITANKNVANGLTWDGIRWAFTTFHASNWHPLTWISHMLDISLFGMQPGGHHLSSLVLHIASMMLLFLFLINTTRRFWPSAVVAALFALHPLHVESVAWVAERKDVLSTFLGLCTIYSYYFYVRIPSVARYLPVLLFFALGLMAKPMLVTIPFILLLLDYWPLQRLSFQANWRKIIIEKYPLLCMSVASSIITLAAQQTAIAGFDNIGFAARLVNAIISYGRYMEQMILPIRLAVHYPFPETPSYILAAVILVFLIIMTWLSLRYGKTMKYLPVGWLWYLVTLVPVIGIVQVGDQAHADRYTYMSLTGIFVIIAFGISDWLDKHKNLRTFAFLSGICVITIFSVLTRNQVSYWKNSLSLYKHTLAVTDNNSKIMTNLAIVMMEDGKIDEAVTVLKQAITAVPDDAVALGAYANALSRQGRYEDALAVNQSAAEKAPHSVVAQTAVANTLIKLRRFSEAEIYLKEAISLNPKFPDAWAQLGVVLQHTDRLDEAVNASNRAIELQPDLATGHLALAGALLKKGDLFGAAEAYKRTVELAPDFAVWFNLAGCLVRIDKPLEAEKAYLEALKLDPTNQQVRELLEELRSRSRN